MTNEKNPHHQAHHAEAENKNPYVEIEKFVLQFEDKLYFYDALYDYMNSFIKSKKIRYDLIRDKPQNLGILIENILRDWLKSKRNLETYRNKLKLLIVK
jgi:hypothetical protein